MVTSAQHLMARHRPDDETRVAPTTSVQAISRAAETSFWIVGT